MGPRRELRDLGRTVADGQHQDATAQRDARCHRVFFRSYAPQVSVDVVSRALTLRRKKFDGAARRRGGGAERVRLVPIVDGYVACLSANCQATLKTDPPVECAPVGGQGQAAVLTGCGVC